MHKALLPPLVALILLAGACSRSAKYYFDKGDQLYAKGSYSDAVLNYKKAIQKDPSFGPAFYQLGLSEMRLSKMADAYNHLSRAGDLLPNRQDVKVTLGDLSLAAYLADRRHPAVLRAKVDKLADDLLAKNPKSYDGLRFKGHLASADQKFADAEEFYRRANEVKPMQPEVIMAWTQAMMVDSHGQQGEDLGKQFLEKNKTYLPMYNMLFRYYALANRIDDAEKILKNKAENNPKDASSLTELAAFYAERSREADMKATLQRLINDPKTFPQAYLAVGDVYFKLQRWDEALAQYNAGAQAYPKNKVIYLKRVADVWLAQGKGEQADHVVDEILAQQPEDEAAKGVRASLLLSKATPDNVAKAATMFQSLVDKNPDNPVWRFNLGRALVAKGDPDKARVQLQEAVKLRRDFLPPRVILAELSLAKHDYRSTLQYTNEILTLNSRSARMRLLHAVSLLNTGEPAQGLTELRALEKESPQDVDVQLELAAADFNQGRLPDAEQRFRKLITDNKQDLRATTGLVRTLVAEKRGDAALSFLDAEVKKSPKSGQLRALLASTEMQAGHYDLAVAQYQELAVEAPNSPQVQLALGNAYRQEGDLVKAVTAFQKAQALAPNDPAALSLLGETLAASGQKSQALDTYRHALQIKPDSPALMNATAYLMAETGGSLDEALKLAQKALAADAQQASFSDTLGWIYFKKNQNDYAVQVFSALTHKHPENATYHYHFGMALLKKGDKKTAESELKAALSQKPSGDVRHDIETALQKIG